MIKRFNKLGLDLKAYKAIFYRWYACLAVVAILILFVVFFAFRVGLVGYYDADIGGYEYELMYEIRKVMEEGTIYGNPEMPPFLLAQKTPAYHYLVGFVAELLQIPYKTEPVTLFKVSRVISLLFNIGSVFVLLYIGWKKLKLPFFIALSIAIVGFMSLSPHYYSRMDACLLFLFLLILYILFSSPFNKNKIFLLVIISIISFWVKQNGILYGVLIMGGIYYSNDEDHKKWIAYYVGLYMLLVVSLMAILFFAETNFLEISKNNISGLAVGKHAGDLIRILGSETYGILIPVTFFSFYGQSHSGLRPNKQLVFVLLFCIITGCFFLLNKGAGVNYLTEWRIVLLLFLAKMGFQVYASSKQKVVRVVFLSVMLFFSIARAKELLAEQNVGEYQNDEVGYTEQKLIAEYLVKELPTSAYIYHIGGESFFNLFLFQQVLFPVKVAIRSVHQSNPNILDYSEFQSGRNETLIQYIIKKERSPLKDDCFDLPFQSFVLDTVLNDYQIWRHNGS